MKQLTAALLEAREGTGEVRSILLAAAFKPRLPGLTKMVSKLSKEGAWRKALELFETVEELGVTPDTALTNSAISACDKGGRWQKAIEIFEHMERMGLKRDAITYSATISALSKGKQWHAALQVFDHMQASRIQADVVTCCSLINALERGGQWQLAERLFLQMCTVQQDEGFTLFGPGMFPSSNNNSSDGLLRTQTSPVSVLNGPEGVCVTPEGKGTPPSLPRVEETGHEEVLASLGILLSSPSSPQSIRKNQHGVSIDLSSSFERTMSLGEKSSSPGQNNGVLFDKPPPKNVTTVITPGGVGRRETLGPARSMSQQNETAKHLRRAMSCFPDLQQVHSTPQTSGGLATMFNFSHAARVTPNRVCCNALLAAYARAKPAQWQRALHLLEAMWGGGPSLCPDAVSYNTVIKACAAAFQINRALEAYREMRLRGVMPNVTTYNTLISAVSDYGTAEMLSEVGDWLNTSPPDIRAACSNPFVAALVKVGRWDDALVQFKSLQQPGSPVRPTAAIFNTIMSGHMKAGEWSAVVDVFQSMLRAGISPSILTFNTLLAAHANMGNWEEAIHALNAVVASQHDGVNPNIGTFNACLAALVTGVPRTDPSKHALLASKALQIYHSMQSMSGTSPDSMTYKTLIRILALTLHHQQVLAVHEVMASQGHVADAATAIVVLDSAMQLGQVDKAIFLAQSLVSQGAQLDPKLLSSLLSTCTNLHAWEAAYRLCEAARTSGNVSAAAMYNFVISAALQVNDFAAVLSGLTTMQNAGVEVSPAVAASVLAIGSDAVGTSPSSSSSLQSAYEGNGAPLSQPSPPCRSQSVGPVTLAEATALLEHMRNQGDTKGALDALNNMKMAGLQPNAAAYSAIIELMVHAGQPHLAVQLCAEAHASGALKTFSLPDMSQGASADGTTLGNIIDVRNCGAEVGVCSLLTWLTEAKELLNSQLQLRFHNHSIKIFCDAGRQAEEILATLTVHSGSSFSGFKGLCPAVLPASALTMNEDGSFEIATRDLYHVLSIPVA